VTHFDFALTSYHSDKIVGLTAQFEAITAAPHPPSHLFFPSFL
jgi:hypothetical protein